MHCLSPGAHVQEEDGERGPAHAQPPGAPAAAGAARLAPAAAAEPPHGRGPGQEPGGGADQEEEAAARAAAGAGAHTGGDPAGADLPGETAQVPADVI